MFYRDGLAMIGVCARTAWTEDVEVLVLWAGVWVALIIPQRP